MSNVKTVPNQKLVRIKKKTIREGDLYAKIEMEALNNAAKDLQAGAFKLWIYFAKNQKEYEMALSNKAVEETFGMKIKQYNNAVKELMDKGYLVNTKGNNYFFYEVPVDTKGNNEEEKKSLIPKGNNAVVTKGNNAVDTKSNNEVITKGNKKYNNNITNNITKDITNESFSAKAEKSSGNLSQAKASQTNPIEQKKEEDKWDMDGFLRDWFNEGKTVYPHQEWKGL